MKRDYRKIFNVLMSIIILYEWMQMFIGTNSLLSSSGFTSLKYFTVLSNLLEAFACILLVLNHRRAHLFKYIAATSVSLTFLVVMVFLGPIFGYPFMFKGTNFWFHLVIPVLSVFEFITLNQQTFTRKENTFVVLPMLIYGIGYVVNIVVNGLEGNDWYAFMLWGYPVGILIFIIICSLTYLIGYILRDLNRRFKNAE